MSTALAPFDFESHEVRVELVEDVPWFRAGDVATSIGLTDSAGRDSIARLEDRDRMLLSIESTPGGQRRAVSFVSEPGMYDMVMDGRKPSAKRFRRWVTSEVLPAIRKTGSYSVAPQSLEQRSLALISELSAVVDSQKATIAAQDERIKHDEPAVLWVEEQSKGEGYYLTKDIVQDSDTSLILNAQLWEALDAWCFVKKNGGHRRFRASFVAKGYGFNHVWTDDIDGRTITRIVPRWFVKGGAALKIKLREIERQLRIGAGDVKPLPRRLKGDRQGRLPEGTRR